MYDDIRARGGNAIMWKTGHSLIKAKMKKVHAALAGEMSGHLFFADRYYGYDDAIYGACRLVEISKNQVPG
jgi:phosphomannomutase/phosphoglucomutase